jgi:hypothetical protein
VIVDLMGELSVPQIRSDAAQGKQNPGLFDQEVRWKQHRHSEQCVKVPDQEFLEVLAFALHVKVKRDSVDKRQTANKQQVFASMLEKKRRKIAQHV